MGDAAAPPARRARVLFAAGVAAALCQVALGARIPYGDEFVFTVAVAWFAALFVARERGPAAECATSPLFVALGAIVVGGAIVAQAWSGRTYLGFLRALPLVTGAGLVLVTAGVSLRQWIAHGKALLLLCLPLLNEPPKALHRLLDPVLIPPTTWSAMALNRAVGSPVTMEPGGVLQMPHESLVVVGGCSGLWTMTRLGVLAALVVALFPTTVRQRLVLAATAVILGFAFNAARIAILAATVLDHDEAGFDSWHQGAGAAWFTVATSAAAGLVWWLMLRRGLGVRTPWPASPPREPSPAPPSAATR
jgi:exosortase/archaeosortase family protein